MDRLFFPRNYRLLLALSSKCLLLFLLFVTVRSAWKLFPQKTERFFHLDRHPKRGGRWGWLQLVPLSLLATAANMEGGWKGLAGRPPSVKSSSTRSLTHVIIVLTPETEEFLVLPRGPPVFFRSPGL